jgi:hypothetical protein
LKNTGCTSQQLFYVVWGDFSRKAKGYTCSRESVSKVDKNLALTRHAEAANDNFGRPVLNSTIYYTYRDMQTKRNAENITVITTVNV